MLLGSQDLRSISAQLIERVRRENPTIRELYLRSGLTGSARIGTPADIADTMQEWFEASACDGFNITPATLPGGGEDFVAWWFPNCSAAGLFRTEYEGGTLRENLGLRTGDQSLQPRPPGRGLTRAAESTPTRNGVPGARGSAWQPAGFPIHYRAMDPGGGFDVARHRSAGHRQQRISL